VATCVQDFQRGLNNTSLPAYYEYINNEVCNFAIFDIIRVHIHTLFNIEGRQSRELSICLVLSLVTRHIGNRIQLPPGILAYFSDVPPPPYEEFRICTPPPHEEFRICPLPYGPKMRIAPPLCEKPLKKKVRSCNPKVIRNPNSWRS